MNKIQLLMEQITSIEKVPVYSVSLTRKDFTTNWLAHAALRGDGRNISVEDNDPEEALWELLQVLLSLVCPHCHKLMDGSDDEKLFEGSGLAAGAQSGGV